ncbi:MAG TPA: right-handed parallel beta-helix repeat-containing protein [Candidatus Sulfotelmatobacter sp.]|nr:right-handed parallel beta-helix repeat-containing protein [Candidatus Sulfotelmatobacter sp.]
MNIHRIIPALLVSAIFSLGTAWGQAHVDESLETAFLYVDGFAGSDSNPGTQTQPFKTIGKAAGVAILNNQNAVGTRVTINAGTYPETIMLNRTSKTTSLPITFQAAVKNTVKISGTDEWTGWQPYSGNSNIFTHAWPYAWGLCPRAPTGPFEQDINLRREMIFVNGAMLTQVLTFSQLVRGTFFVDETNGIVYIFPALGINIGAAHVEVATRPLLFSGLNVSNLVLRGLRFEQSNGCRNNDTVSFKGGSNVLIDADGFNWNNAGGLGIVGAASYTILNTTAKHNGQRGFKTIQAKNVAWNSDEADYNNWRGAQGSIYGWAGGGFYFFQQHDNTLVNLKMFYNQTHAMHWDTDNQNIYARSLISAHNLYYGLVVEKSEGPVTITKSSLCYNGLLGVYYDGGMALRASTNVTLQGNSFANNTISQIPIVGIQGGVPMAVTNYETGEQYNLVTENLVMRSNTIVGESGQQLLYDFDQSGTAWPGLQSTLVSDNNLWWNGSVPQPFTVPVPAYYTPLDWAGWQALTGQDTHSTFAAPAVDPTIPCQVPPDAPDFWFVNFDNGALTVNAGESVAYTMILMPLGSFNGKTFLTSYGVSLIPGASQSWSQNSLTGSGTTIFTIKTSTTTPKGRYPVTMSARSGDVTRTSTVWMTVQ